MIPPTLQSSLLRQTRDLSVRFGKDEGFGRFEILLLELEYHDQVNQNAGSSGSTDLNGWNIPSTETNGSGWSSVQTSQIEKKTSYHALGGGGEVHAIEEIKEDRRKISDFSQGHENTESNIFSAVECFREISAPIEEGFLCSIKRDDPGCEGGDSADDAICEIFDGEEKPPLECIQKYFLECGDDGIESFFNDSNSYLGVEDNVQALFPSIYVNDLSGTWNKTVSSNHEFPSGKIYDEVHLSETALKPECLMSKMKISEDHLKIVGLTSNQEELENLHWDISKVNTKKLEVLGGGAPSFLFANIANSEPNDVPAGQGSLLAINNSTSLMSACQCRSVHLQFDQVQDIVKVGLSCGIESVIEVELQPNDFGRMKLVFHREAEGMAVLIDAEKPETVEQIKRLLDQFNSDVKQMAEAPIRFRFESSAYSSGGRDSQSNSRMPFSNKEKYSELYSTDDEDYTRQIPNQENLSYIDIRA